jgi:CheY-like chemotaxis protein
MAGVARELRGALPRCRQAGMEGHFRCLPGMSMRHSNTLGSSGKDDAQRRRLGRVLVVEDDPIVAVAIEGALLDGGADEVVICPSIAATMEALEQARPDAIILDVHLTDRDDGWALAELVDLLGPKRPRIIFSTGAPQDIPPEIAEMGAVFEKPYDPKELVEVLSSERKVGLFARLRGAR